MSDRLRPLGARRLAAWIAAELTDGNTIFGVPVELAHRPARDDRLSGRLHGRLIETPVGVAAGPHTQLAENIITAWLCGARVIELKTVQHRDRIEVAKPCIDMRDEGYNIEWSQELSIRESLHEYLTAWVVIYALHRRLSFPGDTPGVVFDLSVGYDLAGLKTDAMRWFLDQGVDGDDEIRACIEAVAPSLPEVRDIEIPTAMAGSVTVSTLHGCPPDEIDAIARYLMDGWHLHTTVKLNPTLVGIETALQILHDELGWNHVMPRSDAFEADIGFSDAIALIDDLHRHGRRLGLDFGVKLCNTLPVVNRRPDLNPAEETAYLSGRPLHALAVELALRIRRSASSRVPISFAGGADAFNTPTLLAAGLCPITSCSDLLRPGGYLRLLQYLDEIRAVLDRSPAVDVEALVGTADAADAALARYAGKLRNDPAVMRSTFRRDRTKTDRDLGFFDCVEAPCTDACAVGQAVPEYMRRVAAGDNAGAAEVVAADNPLPTVLGRACHHPCEPVCLRTHLDQPLAIREVKRFITDSAEPASRTAPPNKTAAVAIVGAGPCGLAAANELRSAGVAVTVFDSRDEPGGMVSATIPGYRAGHDSVRRDIERIAAAGVAFELGVRVGEDPSIDDLRRRGFSHVVIAAGAQRGLPLAIDGGDLPGVLDGLDFLRAARCGRAATLGGRVVVIGGGDVAMDCARTALRLGATSVEVLYRRTVAEMPAHPEEVADLLAEGITIRELLAPRRAIPVDGRLGRLECAPMTLGEPDASGRPRPVEKAGESVEIDVDTLIVAIGQRADLSVFGDLGVAVSDNGYVAVDPATLESSIPGIWVGGDLRAPGPSSIVAAAGDGRLIARGILAREGLAPTETRRPRAVQGNRVDLLRRRATRQPRVQVPRIPGSGFEEVVRTLDPTAARTEAARCLDCDLMCSTCESVCPNRAIATYHLPIGPATEPVAQDQPSQEPQIIIFADLCNECGNCVTFCPTAGAPWRDKPRLYFDRADFETADNNAFMLVRRNGNVAIRGRFGGVTTQLTVGESTAKDHRLKILETLLRGLTSSMPHLVSLADETVNPDYS